MYQDTTVFAPGARVVVRDAEWLIHRVDRSSLGGQQLTCIGISELVRDKEAVFLTDIDKSITVFDPAKTNLVADTSSAYQASLLYMESLLRQTPPTDGALYIGHQAAMDVVPYQLDPALKALEQPRQRILIADAVGLGKTLEAGVLVSELIKRGMGKRILVVAIKSMLTQFQKEFWTRFTIPLTRLDSIGLQRVRNRIPSNHNPFFYYDKAIISIDTLKQDTEYRTYLEDAYWDIIVIDEAHNVADRGTRALRNKVARLLARRSDTLIMLSATPHDGKAKSFASLMTMLNPTAIADPNNYAPDDIKGLFVRRFKKDIQDQVGDEFKERKIATARIIASAQEEDAFDTLVDLQFTKIDAKRRAGDLFKTTLEKSLFSSPAACLETIQNRLSRLVKEENSAFQQDIENLEVLEDKLSVIDAAQFSKYQKLIDLIKNKENGFGWTAKDTTDRLVIFTERIETLKFLKAQLTKDLKLKTNQVEILHGALSDVDQQKVVEAFGKEESPVRLLIASDVASEGINLHYLCHRLIHFDIPWSLMVFQQRNGRIDRYGQEKTPEIVYLITESENEKIKGDMRILEVLIDKDEQASKNIGDPSALMKVYDITEEERITAQAIENTQSASTFAEKLTEAIDPLALLLSEVEIFTGQQTEAHTLRMPSLFANDYAYLKSAVNYLQKTDSIQNAFYDEASRAEVTATEDLKYRFEFLPREVWPEGGLFVLSSDPDIIQDEIKRARKDESTWPRIHYLWEQHPVLNWVNDKVLASFKRHHAPVLTLKGALASDETVFLISSLIPNRKGHPLVHQWFGVVFKGNEFSVIESLQELLKRTQLGKKSFPSREGIEPEPLEKLLPQAITEVRRWMSDKRKEFEDAINVKLDAELTALDKLRDRQYEQLILKFDRDDRPEALVKGQKEKRKREIDQIFDEYMQWVEDTMTTEDNPYIQVVAVLKGE